MKICIASQIFAPQEEGGAEISSRFGTIELSRRHDVTVLSLGKEGDALVPPGQTLMAGGIRVVRLPWKNSYLPSVRKPSVSLVQRVGWHVKTALGAISEEELTRFLTQEKFDLIYAQNSAFMQPALLNAARKANIPICLHLRDYALLCPKTSMFRRGENCETPCLDCSIITRRLRIRGEGLTVIGVSHALKQRFVDNGVLDKARWHVMHNKTIPNASLDQSVLDRSSRVDAPFTFGYLGAIAKEKGIYNLLEAFEALPPGKNARLVIAGRGSSSEERKLIARTSKANVEFRGFVAPEDIYRISDAVVLPSLWHEPQSRILIEAAVYGVPVIGTAKGGTPEIIEQQRTGWIYDPNQPGALDQLMEKAVAIGPREWWKTRDTLFPGIATFDGTAEQSGYYTRLEQIFRETIKSQET